MNKFCFLSIYLTYQATHVLVLLAEHEIGKAGKFISWGQDSVNPV